MTRGAARRCALLVAAALAVSACAVQRPRRYELALAAGDRAVSASRWREAADAYDRARSETQRPLDRDEVVYRAGQAWRRAGDERAALERFDWLAAHGDADARAPRGALAAIELRLAHEPSAPRAREDALALVRRWPESGPARRAIDLVTIDLDRRDPSGALALAWLDRALATASRTELGPALHVMRGQRLARMARRDEACAAYEAALAQPYPGNPRWDDAGLYYARLLLELGRPADAVRVIDRVLSVYEPALLRPGSYTRPHFPDLALMRARILRDELGDARRAADAFHTVYADFTTSVLRDNALFEEAELRARSGDARRACDVWTTLAREFPCTRFGRRAVASARACGRALTERETRCAR